MAKKIEVVVKIEAFAGRPGVSIYIEGGLSKHVVDAISLCEELRMLQMLGEFEVRFD